MLIRAKEEAQKKEAEKKALMEMERQNLRVLQSQMDNRKELER